ncbi:MAG: pimeloyl-ACP methyl ester carboxylesterase [Patiriisocius sp.]|jgi:pimeloyl-ACP methyl ester carboxylesterase
MLVLDAPYYSFSKVTGRYIPFIPLSLFLRYPIPTYKWLKYVKCPVHIIHGTNDRIVPYESGKLLSAQVSPSQVDFIIIPNGKHNDLRSFEQYQTSIAKIFK